MTFFHFSDFCCHCNSNFLSPVRKHPAFPPSQTLSEMTQATQLEQDVLAAIELLDALARASVLDDEIRRASAANEPSSSPSSSSPPRPSSAGSGTPPIDAPAMTPGQSSAPSLNRDDLDAAAAVAFVFETAVGAGVTAGAGRALVVAKVKGQRGWWSAPMIARVVSIGAGVSLGVRRCATLAFLGKKELEHLSKGSKVRLSAGASLCLAVPLKATACYKSRKGFSPALYRSTDLGFELIGDTPPDYRVSRGLMADFSLRVSAVLPCDKLTRQALSSSGGGENSSFSKIDREALLSGETPAPVAIRPLARRLNAAAALEKRPAAPWPAVGK